MTEKRRNPITGKMEVMGPRPPRKLKPDGSVKGQLKAALDDLRKQYSNLSPDKLTSHEANTMRTSYRKLSYEYHSASGEHPPKIWDDG